MEYKKNVSVLIPIYDGVPPEYAEVCLKSMVDQTLDNIEVIIIKNGIRNTLLNTMIEKFAVQYDELFVIVENKKNMGIPHSYNQVLPYTKGKYIATQDADDWSDKTRFEKQFNFMEQKEIKFVELIVDTNRIGVLGCGAFLVNEEGKVFHASQALQYLTSWWEVIPNNLLYGGTSFSRKEAIMKVGGYDERFPYCWDYNLWARMHINGWESANLSKWLYYHRIWGGQASSKFAEKQKKQHNKVVEMLKKHQEIKKGKI